jgi:hypothetical protein
MSAIQGDALAQALEHVAWLDPCWLSTQQWRPEQHAAFRHELPLGMQAAFAHTIAGPLSSGQTTLEVGLAQLFVQWSQQRSPVAQTLLPHCTAPPSCAGGGQRAVTHMPFWHSKWAQATVPFPHCAQICGRAPLQSVASRHSPASAAPPELAPPSPVDASRPPPDDPLPPLPEPLVVPPLLPLPPAFAPPLEPLPPAFAPPLEPLAPPPVELPPPPDAPDEAPSDPLLPGPPAPVASKPPSLAPCPRLAFDPLHPPTPLPSSNAEATTLVFERSLMRPPLGD